MKQFILGVLTLVLLTACQDTETNREVSERVSPNGQAFTFMPIIEEGVTDVTIEIAWPSDWAYDPNKNAAVPTVATRAILSGGTSDLAPQDVLLMFEDKNSFGDFVVQTNHIIGSISFPNDYRDEVLPVVQEMLARPQFDDRWLEREKTRIAEANDGSNASPDQKMWATVRHALLGDQPLVQSLSLTDPATVMSVSEAEVRQWHQQVLTKTGVTVSVAGAISEKEAGKAIDLLLKDLPSRPSVNLRYGEVNTTPATILLHDPDAQQTTIGFLGKVPSKPETIIFEDVLAMGFFARQGQSPLFDALRTELRASYQSYAGASAYDRRNHVIYIGAGVDVAKLEQARDVIAAAYDDYRENPDLTEFAGFRFAVASHIGDNFSYVDGAARGLTEARLDGADVSLVSDGFQAVESTLASAVAERMLADYPSSDEMIVVAVSPDREALPGACVISRPKDAVNCR